MKHKKVLVLTLLFLLLFSFSAFAEPNRPGVIFMGEVESAEFDKGSNTLRVLVKGFIKGDKIYKEEVLAIISEDTVIIPNECPKFGEEIEIDKVKPSEFKLQNGDAVLMVLSEAMTKSIPPQSSVQAIQTNNK